VYDPYSGVTNNQAKGINYVLKDLQEWWEALIDCMVLALHYLQGYCRVEIARGQQGIGNYYLHSKFSTLERTQPSLIPEDNTNAPEKIVERIKGSLDRDPLPNSNTSSHQEQDTNTATCQLSQREHAK